MAPQFRQHRSGDRRRLGLDIMASNRDSRLAIEHNGFGERNGFSISEEVAELGLVKTVKDRMLIAIDGQEADGFDVF